MWTKSSNDGTRTFVANTDRALPRKSRRYARRPTGKGTDTRQDLPRVNPFFTLQDLPRVNSLCYLTLRSLPGEGIVRRYVPVSNTHICWKQCRLVSSLFNSFYPMKLWSSLSSLILCHVRIFGSFVAYSMLMKLMKPPLRLARETQTLTKIGGDLCYH
jgi:hypothetical protein